MKINKKSIISLLVLVCMLASLATVAFAEGNKAASQQSQQGLNIATIFSSPFFMIIVMLLIFYFLLIRPENKKKKEIAKMRDSLKAGDKVTTIGGIVGRVVKVKDDELVIETSTDKSKIHIMKWAVSTIDKPANEKKAKNEDAANEVESLEAPEAVADQTASEAEEK